MKSLNIKTLIIVLFLCPWLSVCNASPKVNKKSLIESIIAEQKNKDFIKYDSQKDELVLLLNRNVAKTFAQLAALLLVFGFASSAGGYLSYGPKNGFNDFGTFMLSFIGVGTGLGSAICAIVSLIKVLQNSPTEQYLKLTPEGLEKYSDFLMAWCDVANSSSINVKASPELRKAKTVIRYKTKNNSRIFDLDETTEPLSPISSKDLQKLIEIYIKKDKNPDPTID